MKPQECFPLGHLYMTNALTTYIGNVLPADLDVKAVVHDVRRKDQNVIEPRRFLLLTSQHIVRLTVTLGPLEGTQSKQAKIETEMLPLSAIKVVRREDVLGCTDFEVWRIAPTQCTVTFDADTGLQPIELPPKNVTLPDEIREQYETFGRALFARTLK